MGRMSRWLLLALLGWWTVRFAAHPLGDATFAGASFLHLINLPLHEAGHVFFAPFGDFMTSLGGSTLGWLHLDRRLGMGAHIAGSVVMIGAVAAATRLTYLWPRETCDVMRT